MNVPATKLDLSAARPRQIRYFTPWLLVGSGVWLLIYVNFFSHPVALAARNWPLVVVGV